jgi:hypothetical protein
MRGTIAGARWVAAGVVCAAALLAPCSVACVGAEGETTLAPSQGAAILEADLRAHLQRLASDAFEGRMTAEEGGRRAAEYVAASFARSGLTPLGVDGTWMQPYVLARPVLGEGNRLVARGAEGAEPLTLAVTQDWNPLSVTASVSAQGALVFAGFGISAPDEGHDDYADLDVKGKVVLVIRKLPPDSAKLARHAALLAKVGTAADKGAAALLIVNDEATAGAEKDALFPWNQDVGAPTGSARIPCGFLTRAAAERLLALGGLSLGPLEAVARERKGARGIDGVTVEVDARVGKTETANTANVVGFLRGRDPDVCDEVVVVGAHHDHVGRGASGASLGGPKARGEVHNGADDNASGTVALLEMAEWFGKLENRPRRSLLFLSFSGEELGLLGSLYYVEHPIVPLGDTVAMVNLDMVGRSKDGNVEVGGVGTAKGLQDLVAAANKPHGLSISWDPQGEAPSDSTSFFFKKIPVLFMFTGLHEDYHRPSDDVEKIAFGDLTRITLLTRDVVHEIAEREERLVYTDPPRSSRRPRLGVQPAREPNPNGVALAGVTPDGPAARAGMQAGDVIVAIAGQNVRKVQDLQTVLRKLEPGKPIVVVVLRDGTETTVTVTLDE